MASTGSNRSDPTCPACGATLNFGELVCTACGYNLRTQSKVAVANETVLVSRMVSAEDELTPGEKLLVKPSAGLWMLLAIILNVISVMFGLVVWIVSDHRLAKDRGKLMFSIGLITTILGGGLLFGAWTMRRKGYEKLWDYVEVEKRLRTEPDGLQWTVTFALARSGDRPPGRVIRELLSDDDPAVQDFAAWALGEMHEKTAVAELVECLGSRRVSLRENAAESLKKFGADAVPLLVEQGLKSKDKVVREESRAVLQAITRQPFTSNREWQLWYVRYKHRLARKKNE